jgi:hypothetical protein
MLSAGFVEQLLSHRCMLNSSSCFKLPAEKLHFVIDGSKHLGLYLSERDLFDGGDSAGSFLADSAFVFAH